MADLAITAGNVLASNAAVIRREYPAGATLTAGVSVYLNSDNKWVAADADVAAAAGLLTLRGITLNGAAANQPVSVVVSDSSFTPGATLTVGQVYVTSPNAGLIAPISDLATGQYPQVLFVAVTATVANFQPFAGSAAKA